MKILQTWINIGANYHLHNNPSLLLEEISPRHCFITVCFFFSKINLVFKFNLVLIWWLSSQFIYPFTFSLSVYLGGNPAPSRFFIKTREILMRLDFGFLETLRPQNVLIIFSFSIKHLHLLTTKANPDVNNSLWLLQGMKEHTRQFFAC